MAIDKSGGPRKAPQGAKPQKSLSGSLPTSRPKKTPQIGRPGPALSAKLTRAKPPKRTIVSPPRSSGLSAKLKSKGPPLSRRLARPESAPVRESPPPTESFDDVRAVKQSAADQVLERGESSLLDVVDNLLNQGVVLSGDAVIGVADVDLVYLRLNAVLAAADRILKPGTL